MGGMRDTLGRVREMNGGSERHGGERGGRESEDDDGAADVMKWKIGKGECGGGGRERGRKGGGERSKESKKWETSE